MRHVTQGILRVVAVHGSAVFREVPHTHARVRSLCSAVVVVCREREAKNVLPHVGT